MELKLLQDINVYCIDVLGKLYSLQYVFVHKAAYNHCYMNKIFGHNEQNPILRYNNNPVPLTEDGIIEMPYLKALIDLQPQKYGISTWLHQTGVYKYAYIFLQWFLTVFALRSPKSQKYSIDPKDAIGGHLNPCKRGFNWAQYSAFMIYADPPDPHHEPLEDP